MNVFFTSVDISPSDKWAGAHALQAWPHAWGDGDYGFYSVFSGNNLLYLIFTNYKIQIFDMLI